MQVNFFFICEPVRRALLAYHIRVAGEFTGIFHISLCTITKAILSSLKTSKACPRVNTVRLSVSDEIELQQCKFRVKILH